MRFYLASFGDLGDDLKNKIEPAPKFHFVSKISSKANAHWSLLDEGYSRDTFLPYRNKVC